MATSASYFVGAWVPRDLRPPIQAGLAAIQSAHGDYPLGARCEAPWRWHLTLLYLGAAPAARIQGLLDPLGEIAAQQLPIPLRLDGMGEFKQGRVLWLGPGTPPQALSALFEKLYNFFSKCGFSLEKRPYRPHITLVRAPRPWPLKTASSPAIDWLIDHYSFIESRDGQYRPLQTWHFRRPTTGDSRNG